MIKKICAILLAFVLCVVPVGAATTDDGECEIVINSIEISKNGHTEIIGYIDGAEKGAMLTFLALTDIANDDFLAGEIIAGDTIVYIDQVTLGNNAAFLLKFRINDDYSEADVLFRFGSNTGAEPLNVKYTLPYIEPLIGIVENNSAMYGKDVYTLDSPYLTPQNVANSIIYGGNRIFFKIGDLWYDLLDEKATDNSYLVEENAVDDMTMRKQPLRWYCSDKNIVDFKAVN